MNHPPPSFPLMMGRALMRRCPHCGGKGWFRGWFHRLPRCRTCGFRYERQVGFMLGALTVNIIVTFVCLAVVLVIGTVATYPDLPVVPLVAVSAIVAVVVPVAFYPFSYTVWAAIDLQMRPLEPAESDEAARAVRASSGEDA